MKRKKKQSENGTPSPKKEIPMMRLLGWMMAVYGAFIICCAFAPFEPENVSTYYGLAVHIPIFLLGLLMALFGRNGSDSLEEERFCVREPRFIGWLGIGISLLGMLLLFCGIAVGSIGDLADMAGFSIFGGILLICGILLVMDADQRRITYSKIYDTITYTSFLGRKRQISVGEIGEVQVKPATASYRVLDRDGKKLFGFELNMVDQEELQLLLMERGIPFQLPKTLEADELPLPETKKNPQDTFSKVERQKSGAGNDAASVRLKRIRKGFSLVQLTIYISYVASFILLLPRMKLRYFFLVPALLPLLFYLYYLAFPREILWKDQKPGDAPEWEKYYIRIPLSFLFFEGLHLFVFLELSDISYRPLGFWGMAVYCLVPAALLIAVCLIRMPKIYRKKWEAKILLTAYLLLLSFPLGYSIGFATSVSDGHYPLQVADTSVYEDDGDKEYHAEIVLDDGTVNSISVPEDIYEKIMAGEPLRLCQRKALFGVRFVQVHE